LAEGPPANLSALIASGMVFHPNAHRSGKAKAVAFKFQASPGVLRPKSGLRMTGFFKCLVLIASQESLSKKTTPFFNASDTEL